MGPFVYPKQEQLEASELDLFLLPPSMGWSFLPVPMPLAKSGCGIDAGAMPRLPMLRYVTPLVASHIGALPRDVLHYEQSK